MISLKYYRDSDPDCKRPLTEYYKSWKELAIFLNEQLNNIYIDIHGVVEEFVEEDLDNDL